MGTPFLDSERESFRKPRHRWQHDSICRILDWLYQPGSTFGILLLRLVPSESHVRRAELGTWILDVHSNN